MRPPPIFTPLPQVQEGGATVYNELGKQWALAGRMPEAASALQV